MRQADTQEKTGNLWFATVDLAIIMDETLTAIDKAVFMVLCAHADKNTRRCWPKVKTIAQKAGCGVSAVHNSLNVLEERGLIIRTHRFSEGRQISSVYQIVGYKANCYTHEECPADAVESAVCAERRGGLHETETKNQNHRTIDSKDSFTGEAELPSSEDSQKTFPESEQESHANHESLPNKEKPSISAENSFNLDDVPYIMRSTAELLLFKTGRRTLSEKEISALQELADNQYPARIQAEIRTACERFRRKGDRLDTLTFTYIASALRHQPTWGKKARAKRKPDPMSLTQEQIDAKRERLTDKELEQELARLKAELQAEGCWGL